MTLPRAISLPTDKNEPQISTWRYKKSQFGTVRAMSFLLLSLLAVGKTQLMEHDTT